MIKQNWKNIVFFTFSFLPLLLSHTGCNQAQPLDGAEGQPSLKSQNKTPNYTQNYTFGSSGSTGYAGSTGSSGSSGTSGTTGSSGQTESAQCTTFKSRVGQVQSLCGAAIAEGGSLVPQSCSSAFNSVGAPACTQAYVNQVQSALNACQSIFSQYQSEIPECIQALQQLYAN